MIKEAEWLLNIFSTSFVSILGLIFIISIIGVIMNKDTVEWDTDVNILINVSSRVS